MRFTERVLTVWAWTTGHPRMRKLNNFLLFLGLRGLGVGNGNNLSGETRMLGNLAPRWRQLGSAAVLIDVGGNEGNYAVELRRLCPEARVVAFEPHPATAARLSKRLGGSLEVHALAIGAEPGQATLWDYAEQEGSAHASLISGVIEQLHAGSSAGVEVVVTSLDAFCEEHEVERIDHLKLDVEGSETSCLRGAKRLIKQERVGTVQFEFNAMNVMTRTFFHDFVELLPGFRFYRLLPHGLMDLPVGDILRCNFYGIQNILAVSPRVLAEQPAMWGNRKNVV